MARAKLHQHAPTVRDRAFHTLKPNALNDHLDRQIKWQKITPNDRALITRYIDERRVVANIQAARAFKIMSVLVNWRRFIGPFDQNTADDIYRGIGLRKTTLYNDRPIKQNTLRDYITFLKRFYVWLIQNNYSTIPVDKIKVIKPPGADTMSTTSEDLLTEQEVLAMIDACMNSRDRALISVMYEGAFRIIEMATLEWQHVKFDSLGVVVNTNKKTEKPRYVRLVSSVPLLAAWRKDYPYESTGENLVFITHQHKPLEHGQIALQLKKIAKRCGIKKRIHLHLFRHSRVTHLLNQGCSESVVKMMCWGSTGTKMLGNYAHLSSADVDAEILRLHGIQRPAESGKSLMVARQCQNCQAISEPGVRYCGVCGMPLTAQEGQTLKQVVKKIEDHAVYQDLLNEMKRHASEMSAAEG
jgi:site-specific recombinase XerD